MDLETEVKIKEVGLRVIQSSLLLSCALVAIPGALLAQTSAMLGEASCRMGSLVDKEDSPKISMGEGNPVHILLLVYDIAKGAVFGVARKSVEDTPSQVEETLEETEHSPDKQGETSSLAVPCDAAVKSSG